MTKTKSEPKYLRVVDWIKKQIAAGEFQVGDKLISENELSSRFGVSRQTVRQATSILENSGVLERRRGSGTYVAAVEELRAEPITMNVGVVTTYFDDYLFPCIIRGIDKVLTRNGYAMQLSITYNKVENERSILKNLLKKRLDGLIIEPTKSGLPNLNEDLYRQIQQIGIPCIFINANYQGLDFPVVTMDDYACGRSAAEYLIQKGHKQIGGIFKSDDSQGHLRYAGVAGALTQHNLPLREEGFLWYTTEDLVQQSTVESPELEVNFLQRLQGCTAVVCYNDQVAVRFIDMLQRHGLRIPEDVSVISFDDSYLATLGHKGLTTFVHPKEVLGRTAAENLLSLIDGRSVKKKVNFPPRLMERDSVIEWKG